MRVPTGKTKEQKRVEMETGEKEETVYGPVGREKLQEDDEIDTWEEGFMEGAEDDGEQAKCAFCGTVLMRGKTFETKIKGKVVWFCSDAHIEEYKKKKKIS
jgi:YHS domain-containing protein